MGSGERQEMKSKLLLIKKDGGKLKSSKNTSLRTYEDRASKTEDEMPQSRSVAPKHGRNLSPYKI